MFISSLSSLTRLSRDVWFALNEYLSVEDVSRLTMTGPWWHRRQLFKTIRQIRYFRQPIPTTFIAAMNMSVLAHLDLSNDGTMNEAKYEQYLLHLCNAPLQTFIFPTDRRNESVIHVDITKLPATLTHLNLGIAFPKSLDSDAWRWHEALPHLRALTWPRGRGILDDHFVYLKSLNTLDTLSVHGWALGEVFVASLPESLTNLAMEHSSKIIKQFCEQLPRGLRHLSCPFQHIAQNVKMLPPELVILYYSIHGTVQWVINEWWFASLPPTLTTLAQRYSPRHGRGIKPQVGRYWYRCLPKQLTRLGPIAPIVGKVSLFALNDFPTTLTDLYCDAEYSMSLTYRSEHFPEPFFTQFTQLTTLRITYYTVGDDVIAALHTLTPHLTRLKMKSTLHCNESIITWPSKLTSLGILCHDHGQTLLPSTLTKLKLAISKESSKLDAIAIPASVTHLHLHGDARLDVDLTPFVHVTRLTLRNISVWCEDDIKRLPPHLVSLYIRLSPRSEIVLPARRAWFKHLPRLETLQITKSLD